MKRKSQQHRRRINRPQTQRHGSTLLIVMVLMGMLSLLGVIFYVFAAQERSNAEYYSEASKELEDPGLDADVLFDWALEQIIVGTDARLKNSMLWGSRYSLVSNLVGFNSHRPDPTMQPFNGEGVNVIFDVNSGVLGVDQNRDGTIEGNLSYLLDFVDSPAAQNLTERQLMVNEDTNGNWLLDSGEDANGNGVLDRYPQPDAGFTYPDVNSPFLCYVSKVRDKETGNVHRVVKPSYMVPSVLRPNASTGANASWYNDMTMKARVMRAHPGHMYVPPTQSPATPAPRYIATAAEATSLLGAGGQVFPQAPMASTYDTTSGGAGPITTTGRMGVYSYVDTTGALETVEFDYDNDGDGVNESILIDLDFPPQQDASGKMFVPLFLVTIHDLDALLNMNVHGNLSKILAGPADIGTTPVASGGTGFWFGKDNADSNFYFISQSNLGIGPAEVNPMWALNRRIGIDDTFTFTQHAAAFGNAPTPVTGMGPLGPNPHWLESANMEFFWSKVGRYQVSPSRDLFVGVYGEPSILYNATSSSGLIASAVGGNSLPRPGLSLSDDNGDLSEGQAVIPVFQHPLDFTGQGTIMQSGLAPKVAFLNTTPGTTPDCLWITYNKYNNSNPGTIKWGQYSGLMKNTLTQGLGDDPYEVAFYATDNRDVDSVFTADEMLFLQLNNTEVDRLNVTSRLANLLPFNFDKTKGTQSRAESIRRKFTVQSNDRQSFSFPVSPRAANEYSLDSSTGTMKFPPQFGTIARYATNALAEDPLRPPVRSLLEIEVNGQQNLTRLQRKLSLNGLLTGGATTPMSFRPLTAHPDDPGVTTITSQFDVSISIPAYPPQSIAAQEFWARRDRQQMCRDIYVLLYLLGPGADNVNPTAAGAYTLAQCAEMAQFAVNLVDAMDHDSVVTRFEYDTDLSTGWNLDDDPYTSPSVPPTTTETDRAEVFGVERLDLSISEAMAIRTGMISGDHSGTPWPDSSEHTFGYVELYNHSPFDVIFDDNQVWQIAVAAEGGAERRLSLKSGAQKISSGQWYSIGCADADFGGMTGKSVFRVDMDGSGVTMKGGNWIVPFKDNLDLDLLDITSPSTAFQVEDASVNPMDLTTTPAEWMKQLALSQASKKVTFTLRRRAHPTRTHMMSSQVNDNDNPWVPVDKKTLPQFSLFNLGSASDTQAMLKTAVDAIVGSTERKQPLDANDIQQHAKSTYASGGTQNNTINQKNTVGSGKNSTVGPVVNYTVWQPHFDRDFTSIIDLFLLPLSAPDQLTTDLVNMKTPPESQTTAVNGAGKFLNPLSNPNPNRWHRLLELVEVPTRTNRSVGIAPPLAIPRVPGRINLNMLRHTENWAALLDDMRYYTIDMSDQTAYPPGTEIPPYMSDRMGDPRDWWAQFLISRDGIDPYALNAYGLTIPIPGLPGYLATATPGAKPFRSLADLSYTTVGGTKTASVEDTILRGLPLDTGTTRRRLVEVGQIGDHNSGAVDPTLRHRLLAKMANNSTTRSNNFAIFVSVKYFAAASDPAYGGAIRIGGPLNGKPEPEHRGFFVVDRSKLEQGKYTGSANYDFRAFIDYRKTLATQ